MEKGSKRMGPCPFYDLGGQRPVSKTLGEAYFCGGGGILQWEKKIGRDEPVTAGGKKVKRSSCGGRIEGGLGRKKEVFDDQEGKKEDS